MNIKITGKDLKATEAINDYIERKLERIDKYFEDASAEVTVKTEKNEQYTEKRSFFHTFLLKIPAQKCLNHLKIFGNPLSRSAAYKPLIP